jgi:methionyl-tRNA synthetase
MLLERCSLDESLSFSLVPYTRDLVPAYHSLLYEDTTLLDATKTESLSLEEEYQNQLRWESDQSQLIWVLIDDKTGNIAGDINCFFQIDDDESSPEATAPSYIAELNLMIAKDYRRCGLASLIIQKMKQRAISYCQDIFQSKIDRFIAKIDDQNVASIKLFEKLGFLHHRHLPCFNEVHMIYKL